jgi:hypothetical protein
MDRQFREQAPDPTVHFCRLPSEYFAQQMTVTFEENLLGAGLVPMDWAYLGDSAMWGAVNSHTQGRWSNLGPVMAEMFGTVDARFAEDIVYRRAARIFRLAVPDPADSPDASVKGTSRSQ